MFNEKKDINQMKAINTKEHEERISKTKSYKKSAVPYLTNLFNRRNKIRY